MNKVFMIHDMIQTMHQAVQNKLIIQPRERGGGMEFTNWLDIAMMIFFFFFKLNLWLEIIQ